MTFRQEEFERFDLRFVVDLAVGGKFPPLEAALGVLGVEVSAQRGKRLVVNVGLEGNVGLFQQAVLAIALPLHGDQNGS